MGGLKVGDQFLWDDSGEDVWEILEIWEGPIVFAHNLTNPDEETFAAHEMVTVVKKEWKEWSCSAEFKTSEVAAEILGAPLEQEVEVRIAYERSWISRLFTRPWRPWYNAEIYEGMAHPIGQPDMKERLMEDGEVETEISVALGGTGNLTKRLGRL